jgi:hypothetical protein
MLRSSPRTRWGMHTFESRLRVCAHAVALSRGRTGGLSPDNSFTSTEEAAASPEWVRVPSLETAGMWLMVDLPPPQ